MGLSLPVPDHTTLSRRNRSLSLRLTEHPVIGDKALIVDSSGLKIVDARKWQRAKHGAKPRRQWRKLHIAVDAMGLRFGGAPKPRQRRVGQGAVWASEKFDITVRSRAVH